MRMRKLFLVIIGIIMTGSIYAKDRVKPISTIADSLTNRAYSVVLDYVVECIIAAPYAPFKCSFKKSYAVLSEQGQGDSDFTVHTDLFRSLNQFSGKIYDANGELIQKIKRSDLQTTEYSQSLASDSEFHFYECSYGKYPYTIEYEWSMEYRDAVLSFPLISPISSYDQSLQKASYTITLPKEMGYNYQCINVAEPLKTTTEENKTTLKWKMEAMCAIERESFSPDIYKVIPYIYAEPKQFKYGEYIGSQNRWEELSAWNYTLIKDDNLISEELISTIKQMTDTIASNRDKVKCLYEYLDKTTRYVSIQLGIGGYKPMKTNDVEKTGFGDCKALSLYMKTILKAIDIESNYVIISTKNERLFADYPNVQQSNHIVLQVLLQQDTIWLECTNPSIPFGYIHNGIAGHDALPATKEGSGLIRVPSYPDSLHLESYNVNIILNEDASATGKVVRKSHLSQYEYLSDITDLDKSEQINFLRKNLNFNSATISNIFIKEEKSELPNITVSYDFTTQYRTIGKDIISICTNPFRDMSPHRRREREQDIVINSGFCDIDTIRITIPDNYALDMLPKTDSLKSKFGSFTSQISVEDKDIVIIQRRLLNKGTYSVKDYDQFLELLNLTRKKYRNHIIIKRKK